MSLIMHVMYLQLMTCFGIRGCLIQKKFMCFYIPASSLKGVEYIVHTMELKIDVVNRCSQY